MEDFDIAIIGSSLSGTSTAIRLGKSGARVALIDKAVFPRRKPCGEGLSSYGLRQLDLLGLKEAILQLPHLPYRGYRVKSGKTVSLVESPLGQSITIQREILDDALLRAALQNPHVTGIFGQSVSKIEGTTIHLGTTKLTAKFLVAACGGNSHLLDSLGCQSTWLGRKRVGISAIFKGSFAATPEYVTVITKKNLEVYCTPLAQGRLNVNILGCAESLPEVNLRNLLLSKELLEEVCFETSFRGELEHLPLGRSALGNVRRTCLHPNTILVGDAKEEFDPIGGMGMTHALHSGAQAGKFLLKLLEQKSSSQPLKVLRDRKVMAMRTFTTVCSGTLNMSRRFPICLALAKSPAAKVIFKGLTKELR